MHTTFSDVLNRTAYWLIGLLAFCSAGHLWCSAVGTSHWGDEPSKSQGVAADQECGAQAYNARFCLKFKNLVRMVAS